MFGYIVLAGVGVVGLFALNEARKPTGEKIKDGDSVFVPPSGVTVAEANMFNSASLAAFAAGTIQTTLRVTNVKANKTTKVGTGTIIGFPVPVKFQTTAVVAIERNGDRIT